MTLSVIVHVDGRRGRAARADREHAVARHLVTAGEPELGVGRRPRRRRDRDPVRRRHRRDGRHRRGRGVGDAHVEAPGRRVAGAVGDAQLEPLEPVGDGRGVDRQAQPVAGRAVLGQRQIGRRVRGRELGAAAAAGRGGRDGAAAERRGDAGDADPAVTGVDGHGERAGGDPRHAVGGEGRGGVVADGQRGEAHVHPRVGHVAARVGRLAAQPDLDPLTDGAGEQAAVQRAGAERLERCGGGLRPVARAGRAAAEPDVLEVHSGWRGDAQRRTGAVLGVGAFERDPHRPARGRAPAAGGADRRAGRGRGVIGERQRLAARSVAAPQRHRLRPRGRRRGQGGEHGEQEQPAHHTDGTRARPGRNPPNGGSGRSLERGRVA